VVDVETFEIPFIEMLRKVVKDEPPDVRFATLPKLFVKESTEENSATELGPVPERSQIKSKEVTVN